MIQFYAGREFVMDFSFVAENLVRVGSLCNREQLVDADHLFPVRDNRVPAVVDPVRRQVSIVTRRLATIL